MIGIFIYVRDSFFGDTYWNVSILSQHTEVSQLNMFFATIRGSSSVTTWNVNLFSSRFDSVFLNQYIFLPSKNRKYHDWVVVSNSFNYLLFSPYLGKIPILTNIFQRGWNHELDD